MDGERIVRRIFRMMGVEAVLSAIDRPARANDRDIEIDRDASEFPMSPSREGDVAKQYGQSISIAGADVFQSTRQSSFREQFHKTSEAQEDRIDRELAQMREPSSPNQIRPVTASIIRK